MTIAVALTQGKTALLDDEDADLASVKWQAEKHRGNFYAVRSVRRPRRKLRMHRLVLERTIGPLQDGEETDHINHNGLDNRRSNLRAVSHTQNMRNHRGYRTNNRSGKVGVYQEKRKWRAFISLGGVDVHLGYFTSFRDAVIARVKAERAAKVSTKA